MEQEELIKILPQIWYLLNTKKSIRQKDLHELIPISVLTEEQLKSEELQKRINDNHQLERANELPNNHIEVLDFLTEKGYLDKKIDLFYKVEMNYEFSPYYPSMAINGVMGIKGYTTDHRGDELLDSSSYRRFIETATELKYQIDTGLHRHLTSFEWKLSYSYETTVYELKDQYYDILCIVPSNNTGKFQLFIVEPEVMTFNGKKKKNWKRIREIATQSFLNGASNIDNEIRNIAWKNDYIGILIHNDEEYKILQRNAYDTIDDNQESDFLEVPNFLGKGIFSIENVWSRIFEDTVADFIRDKSFEVKKRYKPDYLKPFEIDVYGESLSGEHNETIIFCECKLRIKSYDTKRYELERFNKKIELIDKHFSDKNKNPEYWFVTNTDDISVDLRQFCKEKRILLKKALIPTNWRKMSNWHVSNILSIS